MKSKRCPCCEARLGALGSPVYCRKCGCLLRIADGTLTGQTALRVKAMVESAEFPAMAYELLFAAMHSAAAGQRVSKIKKYSGRDLCECVREVALLRYGAEAAEIVKSWGIRTSEDVGKIVAILIGNKFLQQTADDLPEDFAGVFEVGDRTWMTWDPLAGNCPTCKYDLRATPNRCPECGWERRGAGSCPECRYDLRGSAGRCPECGWEKGEEQDDGGRI